MTKNLLTCLLATATLSGVASTANPMAVKSIDPSMASHQVKAAGVRSLNQTVSKKQLSKDVQLLTVKDAAGHSIKRLVKTVGNTRINPYLKKAAKTSENGTILSEGFEAWDGEDLSWLPEGFATVSKSERETAKGWEITSGEDLAMAGVGGLSGNALAINFDSELLDEWVVFPEVTLGDNMILSLSTFNDGVWYFSVENVDWDTYEYIGDKIPAYDQKIMISEDGGANWTELKSLAADFADYGFFELLNSQTYSPSKVDVSLAEYSGKKVKLAFRYVGIDGNLGVLDNIMIGYPQMDLSYSNPLGTLYFGMSEDAIAMGNSFLVGPVYKPWVFYNNSYADGAKYSWNYFDENAEWAVSDEQDTLEVTYHTDYTNEFTTSNNLYYTPILNGTAPGYSDGSYTRGKFLQAGGKGVMEAQLQDGTTKMVDLGLGVIDPSAEGATTYSDQLTPVFGYSGDVDNYWSEYTFGEDADENNYVRYNGFMNFFYTGDAPIVINGVRVTAFANISDGAKMKAEILPLSDEGVPAEEAYATAYCEYDDMFIIPHGSNATNDIVTLKFKFDEPVVMSSDVCMAYVVKISGFNDPEHVEYFNPMMSEESNPDGYALGWIEKSIVMDGGEPRTSLTPVVNYLEDLYVSFYIMLDAEYPWLEGPESVNIGAGGFAEVIFDSSVEGKDLKFDNMPDWLSAKAEGIHGDTKVTFQIPLTDQIKGSATVTVTAPGVSHDIIVNADSNGVSGIEADAAYTHIYDLSGTRVKSMDAAGVYIVKDASGKVKKIIKD